MFELNGIPQEAIPVLIFLARVVDVTLGTIRIILVARGLRLAAAVLGFLEITIWLLAISQIMANLTSIENYLAYAAGFATGTFLGISIERKLAIGYVLVRIIVPREASDLVMYLIAQGHKVTYLDAQGTLGSKTVVFTIIPRSALNQVLRTVKEFNPNAFYTVEDVRSAKHDSPAGIRGPLARHLKGPFHWFRKGK